MRVPILLSLLITKLATAQLPVETHPDQLALLESTDATLAANKKLVFDYWREVIQAHAKERLDSYLAEAYVEHRSNVAGGRAALATYIEQLPQEPVRPTIDDLVTIVAERDIVILAFRVELLDLAEEGQTYTTTAFEMFRIDNHRIAEHWDNATRD